MILILDKLFLSYEVEVKLNPIEKTTLKKSCIFRVNNTSPASLVEHKKGTLLHVIPVCIIVSLLLEMLLLLIY